MKGKKITKIPTKQSKTEIFNQSKNKDSLLALNSYAYFIVSTGKNNLEIDPGSIASKSCLTEIAKQLYDALNKIRDTFITFI